jgi:hypothetical protein
METIERTYTLTFTVDVTSATDEDEDDVVERVWDRFSEIIGIPREQLYQRIYPVEVREAW